MSTSTTHHGTHRDRAGTGSHTRQAQRPTAVSALLRDRFTGVETARVPRGASSAIPVLLLFAAAVCEGVDVPGTGLPLSSLALVPLVLVSLFFPATAPARPPWFPVLVVAVPVWLGVASLLHGDLDTRRIGSIALWAAVALVLSSGRIPLFMVARGLALGITVAGLYAMATIGSSAYEGRVTGWFGDPNTAGLFLLTMLLLSIPYLPSAKTTVVVVLVGLAATVLTLSRTTLLAAGIAALWMVLGGKLNRVFGVLGVAGVVLWILRLPDSTATIGPFHDREGSDALRERITAEEEHMVTQSPWAGHGAGTARVDVDGMTFFFHNSYLAIRAEAGWIGLALLVGLFAATFVALVALPTARRSVWLEGSLVSVAVCATNLGEVFLAIPGTLVLGFAGHHLAVQYAELRREREQERLDRWARRLARGQVAGSIS
ncbi:O-antigen ligase family protein [Kocuria sp.]|uniref:O-antigen ligase family protein n=1 Tax=Kocuria sp. TaxID=1871328 RepID=UPI0026DB0CB9|nr:O-antigen ligase family protein [Kocuria sp.]MDO4919670.1 O-antigen ligase family protein [Kocuria sp.]